MNELIEPKCNNPDCDIKCWAYGQNPAEPCWGEMRVSEDYPGMFAHFCDGHGHREDRDPYQHKPIEE